MVNISLILLSFVFGPISMVCSILMILMCIFIKKLRKRVPSMIIMLSVGQCIYDLTWIISYPEFVHRSSIDLCRVVNILFYYSTTIIVLYNLGLTLIILSTVQNIKIPRSKGWHIVYNSIAVTFAVLILVLNDEYKEYEDVSCFLYTKALKLTLCIFLLALIIISLALAIYVTRMGKVKRMRYHLRITIIYSSTFTPFITVLMTMEYFDDYDSLILIFSAILASLAGFLVFVFRVCDRHVIRRIRKKFMHKEHKMSIEFSRVFSIDRAASEWGYPALFKTLLIEVIHIQNVSSLLSGVTNAIHNVYNSISMESGSSLISLDEDYVIEELFYKEFKELRDIEGVSNEDLVDSLHPEANINNLGERASNPGGKGNGFIFFTYDQKVIIKTLKKSELKCFVKMFPEYHKRVTQGKTTFLARIYGAYKLKIHGMKIACLLFENILGSTYLSKNFDLKGSDINRRVINEIYHNFDDIPHDLVLKDIDFYYNVGSIKIKFKEKQRIFFHISRDIKLLEHNGIMDYSLLLAIQDTEYDKEMREYLKYRTTGMIKGKIYHIYIAIIDYFQKFNFRKKAELQIKSIKHGPYCISSIPPGPYMARFLKFLDNIFLGI